MDAINDILNEIVRQQIEHRERTLAEIVEKYDFMVCSTELMNQLEEVLPEGTRVAYSPYIGDPTTIYAIKRFDVMDLLNEALKEQDAADPTRIPYAITNRELTERKEE